VRIYDFIAKIQNNFLFFFVFTINFVYLQQNNQTKTDSINENKDLPFGTYPPFSGQQ
jgi:hypothetical protein